MRRASVLCRDDVPHFQSLVVSEIVAIGDWALDGKRRLVGRLGSVTTRPTDRSAKRVSPPRRQASACRHPSRRREGTRAERWLAGTPPPSGTPSGVPPSTRALRARPTPPAVYGLGSWVKRVLADGLKAYRNQRHTTVKRALIDVFETVGTPFQILCDHGPPWGASAQARFTKLGVWLIEHGTEIIHGRPRHPRTQGKDERFHRTSKPTSSRLATDAYRAIASSLADRRRMRFGSTTHPWR